MTLRRYLDESEEYRKNWWAGPTVEYRGNLDSSGLRYAYEVLCTRYPELLSRIRFDGQGYLLYTAQDCHPGIIVRYGSEVEYLNEISLSRDYQSAVASLVLIRGHDHGFVMLAVNAAINDGARLVVILRELWDIYTEVINGVNVPLFSGAHLPAPASAVLNSSGSTPSLASRREGRSTLATCPVIQRHVQLGADETSRLIEAARANNTSVHGLICAAILVAQRSLSSLDGEALMHCWSLVNLRRGRASSNRSQGDVTGLVGHHVAIVNVGNADTLIGISRSVKEQLESALARGDIGTETLESPPAPVETLLEQRLALAVVSNVGVLPALGHPSELEFIGMRFPLLGNPALTPLFPSYGVRTFSGCLSMRIVYPDQLFTEVEVDCIKARCAVLLSSVG